MYKDNSIENLTEIFSNKNFNNKYLNIIIDLQHSNIHQISSLFDDLTLINNQFQVFTSLILCIMSFIGTFIYIGIFIRRCFHTKSFSHEIFIQSLFDSCHLINILLTHIIVIIVYIKTSRNINLSCPISTFFFSLTSFGSICFLCLGAFNRYMFSSKKQTQYRCIHHRLLAHRFILITLISWIIVNFPKLKIFDI